MEGSTDEEPSFEVQRAVRGAIFDVVLKCQPIGALTLSIIVPRIY